jgi:carnitine 3-dehydrogenase
VAIVGAGVIGGGWALHFLRMGLHVDVYDPAPQARGDLLRMVEETWPMLERIGLRAGAHPDRLSFHADLAATVSAADMVQENSPEDGPVKRGVLAAIDRAARPDAVIASSTSGFAMTMLQADCARPERCVVGHPFNPPYLIPLVEVVGGERTDPAAVDWLAAFYAAMGKRPLRLSRELPGFVGNRLQEAMWREALHMVAAGEATVEEIDEAIAYGPGLRWAQMGPCLTFHLAAGGGVPPGGRRPVRPRAGTAARRVPGRAARLGRAVRSDARSAAQRRRSLDSARRLSLHSTHCHMMHA